MQDEVCKVHKDVIAEEQLKKLSRVKNHRVRLSYDYYHDLQVVVDLTEK